MEGCFQIGKCMLSSFISAISPTRNERAGVPCEVLQVLKASVQIPQSGTVRSLNVHVSGALFVWEYTRQILTRSSNTRGAGGGDGKR